jgi:hypothetical protein
LFGIREEQSLGRDLDSEQLSWPKPTQPAALSRDDQPSFIVQFCTIDFVHKLSQIQTNDNITAGKQRPHFSFWRVMLFSSLWRACNTWLGYQVAERFKYEFVLIPNPNGLS